MENGPRKELAKFIMLRVFPRRIPSKIKGDTLKEITDLQNFIEVGKNDFIQRWNTFKGNDKVINLSHSFSVTVNHIASWWVIGTTKASLLFIVIGPRLNINPKTPSWEVFQNNSPEEEERIQVHLKESVKLKKIAHVPREF